jgi:hypothetical protein
MIACFPANLWRSPDRLAGTAVRERGPDGARAKLDVVLDEPRTDSFLAVDGLCIDQEVIRDEDLPLTRADDQDARSLSGA